VNTVIRIDRAPDHGRYLVERVKNAGTTSEEIDGWTANAIEVSWRARSDLWRLADPPHAQLGPTKESDRELDRRERNVESALRPRIRIRPDD